MPILTERGFLHGCPVVARYTLPRHRERLPRKDREILRFLASRAILLNAFPRSSWEDDRNPIPVRARVSRLPLPRSWMTLAAIVTRARRDVVGVAARLEESFRV